MADHVIVPIDVAALVVAGSQPANTGFAPPLTRFDSLPYGGSARAAFNSEAALNNIPLEGQQVDVGVRIHWAMPDALMNATRPHGKTSAPDSGWTFPALPDLWLVTRVARVPGKPDLVRSWVVDSRFVASATQGVYNVGSSAVPWENANDPAFQQPPFRYLGRAVPLDDWQRVAASGDRIDRLYAGSFGMVEIAAFYPNVVNVFGIFDQLGDVPIDSGAELCYAVTGWHSRATDDPLAGKTLAEAIDKLKDFDWSVNVDAVTDATDWKTAVNLAEAPAGTAYCGMVHSVKWATPAQAGPNALKVAFGNTTSEAVAALIVEAGGVSSPADADALEFNLHALLTSQLPVLADTAGQRLVTRQLHKSRFSPVTATAIWYARRSSDGADVSASLSDTLRAQLDHINSCQNDADTLRNQVLAQRWQVYADWLKYLEVKYGDNPLQLDPDHVAGFMQGADTLGGTVVRSDAPLPAIEAAITSLTAAEAALKAALAQFPSPGGADDDVYTLAQKPGEIFFQPSDPTVLLAGADVVPTLRYGGDTLHGDDGALSCRTGSTLVSALQAPAGAVPSSSAIRLGAQDLPGLGATIDPSVLGGVSLATDYLLEAALLWPGFTASRLAAKGGGDPSAWKGWLEQRENSFLEAKQNDTSVYQGRKPSPVGIHGWDGNPWLPIMLQWQIDYRPIQSISSSVQQQPTLDPRLILGRLADPQGTSLDSDATELILAGALSTESTTYFGINFITPHAGYAAFTKLAEYAAANPKSPLAKLAAKQMPLLSQALTGFHDRFLLRRRTLQLDVRDPLNDGDPDTVDFIGQVVAAVDASASHANIAAPMVKDSFCPVRAGSLEFNTVWLVDAFGQYRTYQTQSNLISTVPARAVNPRRLYSGAAADAFMPPRISQPALLRFNWLAANSDSIVTGTEPGATPICGWLVPNYLDVSLMAYENSGAALGSVVQVDRQVRWLASPTRPNAFGETSPVSSNQHLLDFLNALIAKGPEYLIQFLDTLNAASASIQPLQHAQSARLPVLVGQPLALVRTSLELNLMGPAAINNNWAAFRQDLQTATGGTTTPRTTNGQEAVQFPVLVGSVEDPDDGLFGFYFDSSFDTFHAIVPGGDNSIPTRTIGTVSVSVGGGPVVLSMLVDPRCDIHATTGYMPVQALRIPTEMFRDAFDNLAVTFLTAPVLAAAQAEDATPSIALPLPLPGQQDGDWSWLSVKGSDGGTRSVEEVKPVASLKPGVPFSDPRYELREGWLSLKGFEQ